MKETRKLPGAQLPDHYLFEQKIEIGTNKPVGVKAPNGEFYRFRNGEELVQIQSGDGKKRDSYIRVIKDDGSREDIPFDVWVKDHYKE